MKKPFVISVHWQSVITFDSAMSDGTNTKFTIYDE